MRPQTELDDMAKRIADVLNGIAPRLPIKPEDVDLRIFAELCWALGVHASIDLLDKKADSAEEHADIQELLINGDPMRGIAPGALDKAISAHQSSSLESAIEFVAKMCWRSDPPNANAPFTIEERFSAIKYHPTIKKYGKDHP